MVDANLQQAEQMAPTIMNQYGGHVSVDGEPGFGIMVMEASGRRGYVQYGGTETPVVLFNEASHPQLMFSNLVHPATDLIDPTGGGIDVGVNFSNYANTVGNQFGVRACDVETHSATQSLLASSPEVRDFISNRIAEHQNRLQGLLEPAALNTRFNFIPLEIADRMVAPGGQPCSNDLLAVASPKDASIFQMILVSGVCSFATGLAVTYGALRKKSVVSADAYHEVSA